MSGQVVTGSVGDMVARLKAALPSRWFADATPVLDTVLTGLGDAASRLHGLLTAARLQMRLATASAGFLDLIAADFFDSRLRRGVQEGDEAFRIRIARALTRTHGTRAALIATASDLTGTVPTIFEPSNAGDTGGYAAGGAAWNTAGGWGSLSLPFQFLVTVKRPHGQGIAVLAGYGSGGVPGYGSLSMIVGQVTDEDILAAVAGTVPVGTIAWTRIIS